MIRIDVSDNIKEVTKQLDDRALNLPAWMDEPV